MMSTTGRAMMSTAGRAMLGLPTVRSWACATTLVGRPRDGCELARIDAAVDVDVQREA